ncbi:MAG: GGDEF domain-containing protein [Eubacteriales bacterium]|nr:GGDEF domain-containing protein [Eubacteriales bacterium]
MKNTRISTFLSAFQNRHTAGEARSAVNLLVFQLIYLVLIFCTMILCLFVDRGERLAFYLLLLGGLMGIVAVALAFNLRGRYPISGWLTSACMVFGPWLSILLDPTVLAGDFVPLIYIGMSIQLCSILLSERVTLVISAIQICGVVAAVSLSPALRAINWPSLIAFIVFTSVIGILYGFTNKRQLAQIEKQRNQLLEDEAKLRELSVRDSLTGLFNRRYMEETLDRETRRATRKQLPLTVIMTDIDGFKVINDSVGHVLGDNALIKVSAFLNKSIRASDVACRFGGDEFCLILPDCSLEEGVLRANSMRNDIERLAFNPNEEGINGITLSFGVAALPDNGVTREELIGAADAALYSSKRAGRNRVNGKSDS